MSSRLRADEEEASYLGMVSVPLPPAGRHKIPTPVSFTDSVDDVQPAPVQVSSLCPCTPLDIFAPLQTNDTHTLCVLYRRPLS